jgi:L-fuconolactonase
MNEASRASEVVDAHHHLIYPNLVEYPDIERHMAAIHRPFTPDDLTPLLAEAGVDATICVQAANDEAETALLLDVVREVDWLLGLVGWLPIHDPEATRQALARFDDPALLGCRYLIHREPDPAWLCHPPVVEALAVLADAGLVYELVALAKGHLDNAPLLLETVPDLDLVIDHLGGPNVRGDRWEPWASIMAMAAQHPRCSVKLSGLDPIDGSVEPYRRYVDHVLEHFGSERVMWASNWPATRLGEGYRVMLDDAQVFLAGLSPGDRDAVLGANARRIYRC